MARSATATARSKCCARTQSGWNNIDWWRYGTYDEISINSYQQGVFMAIYDQPPSDDEVRAFVEGPVGLWPDHIDEAIHLHDMCGRVFDQNCIRCHIDAAIITHGA